MQTTRPSYAWTSILLLALCGVALGAHWHWQQARFEQAQADSPLPWLSLPEGKIRYRVDGAENKPAVVLIHSFNGSIESWQPTIPALVAAGFRVISYDLWGRGLSDFPDAPLDMSLYRRQLTALMDALDIPAAHLVGSSFGCVIAADFAARQPARVNRLVLTGPAGFPVDGYADNPLIKIPLLGELIFHLAGDTLLRPSVEAYFTPQSLASGEHQWALDTWDHYAAFPGIRQAALSTLRHAPVMDNTEGWQHLGAVNIPVMFIWGKADTSFPFDNTRLAKQWIARAEIVPIADAAHWLTIEQPQQVNRQLVDYLRRK